jgi:hypothetical protein
MPVLQQWYIVVHSHASNLFAKYVMKYIGDISEICPWRCSCIHFAAALFLTCAAVQGNVISFPNCGYNINVRFITGTFLPFGKSCCNRERSSEITPESKLSQFCIKVNSFLVLWLILITHSMSISCWGCYREEVTGGSSVAMSLVTLLIASLLMDCF